MNKVQKILQWGKPKSKPSRRRVSGGKNDEEDEDDWEMIDEHGECTNYEPESPYALLFKERTAKTRVHSMDFERLALLGRGATGTVCLVRFKRDGKTFALKSIDKKDVVPNSKNEACPAIREKEVLKRTTGCQFLVKMHYCFQSKTKLYFVLDYMAGGTIFSLTKHLPDNRATEKAARHLCAQVYLALTYLHDHGIIYRDLKAENVLLDENGNARLADFGISRQLDDGRAQSFVGSAYYIAPEILTGAPYSYAVDWWSFGVLCYNLITGEYPFYGKQVNDIFNSIVRKNFKFYSPVSPEAADLIGRLLTKDESKRLTADGIKSHPWFANFDWSKVYLNEPAPGWQAPNEMINEAEAANMNGQTVGGDSVPVKPGANGGSLFADFSYDNTQAWQGSVPRDAS